jgi:hypothetical protein
MSLVRIRWRRFLFFLGGSAAGDGENEYEN